MAPIEVFAVVNVHTLRVFKAYKQRSTAQGQATRLNNAYNTTNWVVVPCYGKAETE